MLLRTCKHYFSHHTSIQSPYKPFSNLPELGISAIQLGHRRLKVGNFLKCSTLYFYKDGILHVLVRLACTKATLLALFKFKEKHCIKTDFGQGSFLNIVMINKFYRVSSSISGNNTDKHSSLECNVFEPKTKHEVGRFFQHYFYTK